MTYTEKQELIKSIQEQIKIKQAEMDLLAAELRALIQK